MLKLFVDHNKDHIYLVDIIQRIKNKKKFVYISNSVLLLRQNVSKIYI